MVGEQTLVKKYLSQSLTQKRYIHLILRWMKGFRNVQRGSQKIEKEMEIRSNLAE